jgi:hypothetical protein
MSDPPTPPADDSELTRLHRKVDDLEQALEAAAMSMCWWWVATAA